MPHQCRLWQGHPISQQTALGAGDGMPWIQFVGQAKRPGLITDIPWQTQGLGSRQRFVSSQAMHCHMPRQVFQKHDCLLLAPDALHNLCLQYICVCYLLG